MMLAYLISLATAVNGYGNDASVEYRLERLVEALEDYSEVREERRGYVNPCIQKCKNVGKDNSFALAPRAFGTAAGVVLADVLALLDARVHVTSSFLSHF